MAIIAALKTACSSEVEPEATCRFEARPPGLALVVGIDGAEHGVESRLREAGRLPSIDALADGGRRRSVDAPKSRLLSQAGLGLGRHRHETGAATGSPGSSAVGDVRRTADLPRVRPHRARGVEHGERCLPRGGRRQLVDEVPAEEDPRGDDLGALGCRRRSPGSRALWKAEPNAVPRFVGCIAPEWQQRSALEPRLPGGAHEGSEQSVPQRDGTSGVDRHGDAGRRATRRMPGSRSSPSSSTRSRRWIC